jgi:hypothetical protein
MEDESDYSEDQYSDGGSEYTESIEDTGDEDDDDDHHSNERQDVADDYSDAEELVGGVMQRRSTAAKAVMGAVSHREKAGLLPLHAGCPADYAPDRWPPLLDFLFVFSSFVAAVIAAYFTLF